MKRKMFWTNLYYISLFLDNVNPSFWEITVPCGIMIGCGVILAGLTTHRELLQNIGIGIALLVPVLFFLYLATAFTLGSIVDHHRS